ncbi:MAG: toxic anion resistance protein [Oscillospiraceae bacterium]|nr:toxic anion resistance protein [Oscillospiraceae bacterium]
MDEKIPELTLTPDLSDIPSPESKPQEQVATTQKTGPDLSGLSPAEQKAVLDFADKIDLTNSGVVLQYGAAAQKNIANFSESTLNAVRTKDMGELGDMVTNLLGELKGFSAEEEEKKGFFGMFKKASNNLQNMKIKYEKAEENVDRIAEQLEQHQMVLMKDAALLDQMYDKNLEYFKQLSMYILAGEKKLADERATTLQELYAKAQASGLPEDAQAANDYAALCDRFEKKLYDLKLTRQISIQMGPQIRMIQNNDTLMTEKIQTSLVNTIPLWKSQMVLALGINHSKQAMEAQRAVSDMTNELLKKNADMLKVATIETAKESERGIVDIETLQHTNESLISTLDEVMTIQTEGRQKRKDAEAELQRIEGQLRQKLLEVRQ